MHERRVIHAVHSQSADEVSFKKPECLSQEQRIRDFRRDAVHNLAPELLRDRRVERLPRHAMLGPRRDRAARAWFREPQALDMFLGERHRRVEADDRKVARDMQNCLNNSFAHFCFGVIKLRGVIPGK